ncbi:hypothetical protein QQ045_012723 [Rhodiola kirilowii]
MGGGRLVSSFRRWERNRIEVDDPYSSIVDYSRLGPPDYHPQNLNCPEETLTREYAQSGYTDMVEGLEAGQVYGGPLAGSLLSNPGIFPDQKPCSEDYWKRWIEVSPGAFSTSGTPDKTRLSLSELWTILESQFSFCFTCQGKEWVETFQLMLPVIYSLLEIIIMSQTHVRKLVGAAIRFMKEPSPTDSDLVDNSRTVYATFALIELLRYLIVAVPEIFVAVDCFPLPQFVFLSEAAFLPRLPDGIQKKKLFSKAASSKDSRLDSHYWSSLNHIVASIQAHADSLAKAGSPGYPGYGAAKAVQALD